MTTIPPNLLESLTFVLQPGQPQGWEYATALEALAYRFAAQAEFETQWAVAFAGNFGDLVAELSEIHGEIASELARQARQTRRQSMAIHSPPARESGTSPPRLPHLTLLPGYEEEEEPNEVAR